MLKRTIILCLHCFLIIVLSLPLSFPLSRPLASVSCLSPRLADYSQVREGNNIFSEGFLSLNRRETSWQIKEVLGRAAARCAQGFDRTALSRLSSFRDVVIEMHVQHEDMNNEKLLNDPRYQELVVFSSYIAELEVSAFTAGDKNFAHALSGCSSPTHLLAVMKYWQWILSEKAGEIYDDAYAQYVRKIFDGLVAEVESNLGQFYEDDFEPGTDFRKMIEPGWDFRTYGSGGTIGQVFLHMLERPDHSERPVDRLLKMLEERRGQISALWIMPQQFYRGWNGIYSPYGRSANCSEQDTITAAEELRLIQECSKMGITIFFDKVLNHTGRDEIIGLDSGPYPDDCYVKSFNNATITWDGHEDVKGEYDTMKLNYENHDTWMLVYQEMASVLRRVGWNAESNLKVGFRFDIAGMVPPEFWHYACARFKQEFGAVPPMIAEWADTGHVDWMFAGHAIGYAEDIRQFSKHGTEYVANSGDHWFGNLRDMVNFALSRPLSSMYAVLSNHDEKQHWASHEHLGGVIALLGRLEDESKITNGRRLHDEVAYPLAVYGLHTADDKIYVEFEKLRLYMSLIFLGFPPNIMPCHLIDDEIVYNLKFLSNDGSLPEFSAQNAAAGMRALWNKCRKDVVGNDSLEALENDAADFVGFFRSLRRVRATLMDGVFAQDYQLLRWDNDIWAVKYKKGDSNYYVLLNKAAPQTMDESGFGGFRECDRVDVDGFTFRLKAWQALVVRTGLDGDVELILNSRDGEENNYDWLVTSPLPLPLHCAA